MFSAAFQQPYVFAVVMAVLTATIVYLYNRTLEDKSKAQKTFFKTLTAGLLAGLGLAWLTRPKPEALSTEPFMETSPAI